MIQPDILQTIIKDSNYNLSLFSAEEIENLRTKVFSKTIRGKETALVNCVVRNKEIQLKPEEIVRQLYAVRLMEKYGYAKKRQQPKPKSSKKLLNHLICVENQNICWNALNVRLRSPLKKTNKSP
ncbi:MAG TPA: hypothetical protein PKO34_01375 [Smithellaceae bacterium]|jgi:hypothetical protein|nr:hypothetical protein [Smithellaceae bacterium]